MNTKPTHAKFWDRFAAYLLDAVLVGVLSFGLNYLNILYLKSFWPYLIIALAGILYKPYLESRYMATVGKMAMNLQVTDRDYKQIGFERSLLRSLIVILPAIMYIPAHYIAFDDPYIVSSTGVFQFTQRLNEIYPAVQLLTGALSWLAIADIIVYLVDKGNLQRSLKDFIAKTYVIENK